MPFLEAVRSGGQGQLSSRVHGYEDDCWRTLDRIVRIAKKAGLSSKPLPFRVLNVGPCPGLWRTYYTARFSLPHAATPPHGLTAYLGRPTTSSNEGGLGSEVESWVHQANEVTSEFTQNRFGRPHLDLDQIVTPILRDYCGAEQGTLAPFRMGVQPTRGSSCGRTPP